MAAMESMEGILRQELLRLQEAEKSYVREIAKLPRGSLQEKRIKGIIYPYLVSSKNSKISFRYLGSLSDPELKKLKEDIVLRKKYQALLRQVRQNIKRIRKIVRGKKRTI